MKKVFIDGGARVGESLDLYVRHREDLINCDIHFFECNPPHISFLDLLKLTERNYNIHVHNKALWNQNGFSNFYIANDVWGDVGSTLDNTKVESLDLNNPLRVETIKVSDFILSLNTQDYIILKLDIEGAEYEVIYDLINTGAIQHINELLVEYHQGFFPNKDWGRLGVDLENIKRTYPIKVETWMF